MIILHFGKMFFITVENLLFSVTFFFIWFLVIHRFFASGIVCQLMIFLYCSFFIFLCIYITHLYCLISFHFSIYFNLVIRMVVVHAFFVNLFIQCRRHCMRSRIGKYLTNCFDIAVTYFCRLNSLGFGQK